MTVITKSLGEKKSDNLQEPLVENIVVEHADDGKRTDVEAGGYPIPPPQSTRYIISARVRPYYSLMFILLLCLLVATSLLGIFGAEYLFDQYKYLVGQEEPGPYRAWTSLSYEDDLSDSEFETRVVPARFERIQDSDTSGLLSMLFRNSLMNNEDPDRPEQQLFNNKIKEQFELDVEKNYEKINVPAKTGEVDMPSRGSNRFVHDFYSNYTAIVDVDQKRCYIMPLDRSLVLPPRTLKDLILKMSDGYYAMDMEKIRRDMTVTGPMLERDSLGEYIKQECDNYDLYKLEKAPATAVGIRKRSTENRETFTYFDGKNILEISVQGLEEPMPRAIP